MLPEEIYDYSKFLIEWELYIAYQYNKAVYSTPKYNFNLN